MRRVTHTYDCEGSPYRLADDKPCLSTISLTIEGGHNLRSVGQELEDLAKRAGWSTRGGTRCPDHAIREDG